MVFTVACLSHQFHIHNRVELVLLHHYNDRAHKSMWFQLVNPQYEPIHYRMPTKSKRNLEKSFLSDGRPMGFSGESQGKLVNRRQIFVSRTFLPG
jgi:hypothetical protein